MPRPSLDRLMPADAPTARRFLAIVLAVFVAGLGLHAGFNQLVDPLGLYGSPVDLPRQQSQRALKADLLERAAAPAVLLLGSSRVRALDPAHAAHVMGRPVFHAGVGGGTADDWLAFTGLALEVGHPLDTLLIGVDAGTFTWPVNRLDHPAFVPALRRQLPLSGWRWLMTRTSWWSPVLTRQSWRTLTGGAPRDPGVDWRPDGYNPRLPPASRDFVLTQLIGDFSGEYRPRPSHLRDLDALLDLTAAEGVRVVLFEVPESPEAREVLVEHTHYPRVAADTAALVEELALAHRVVRCEIEPLVPRDYVDPVHCSEEAGRHVLDQLAACADGAR